MTPTYDSTNQVHTVPYTLRGHTYYSIKVENISNSNTISAKYWVAHDSDKIDQVGTQLMYDPNAMTLNGFYEPCSTCYGQKMNLTLDSTSDGLRWIKAEGAVNPGDFGLIGFDFQVNYSTYFNFTKMDNVVRHSFAGPSVNYTLAWTSPITRVYGNTMVVY